VDDLCGLAARRDPVLRPLAGPGHHAVVACHARAVRWLLRFAGIEIAASDLTVLNMREQAAGEIIQSLSQSCALQGSELHGSDSPCRTGSENQLAGSQGGPPPSWMPWFPVIDYDRCVSCGRCLEFCLFGVYGEDDQGAVRVERPSRCKTNCPACARTCPEVAIMFPKYPEGPISGTEVRPEDLSRGDLRVQPARQRQDIEAALRRRGLTEKA
jgi:NAD-dependent dihydropyrimidine dehydrogenase PreA subunit